jgi:hypothetical protein
MKEPESAMTVGLEEFEKQLFKGAQRPAAWLRSAERLRDAAEVVLEHEVLAEIPFFKAVADAEQRATAEAYSDGNESGVAEIEAIAPNYPPAQLLYAYAIENLLKGLIIANQPSLIEEQELNNRLKSHNLIRLAGMANFSIHVQERPVLEALSHLSLWAGRYPVSLTRREYAGKANSDELLDFGSAHPYMRGFFERAQQELKDRLVQPIESKFGAVVVFRQPSK